MASATRFVIMPPDWAQSDNHVCRTLGRGKKYLSLFPTDIDPWGSGW